MSRSTVDESTAPEKGKIFWRDYFDRCLETGREEHEKADYHPLSFKLSFDTFFQKVGIDSDITSLLDVGCGTGFFLSRIEERVEIFGVDISAKMLKYAKNRVPRGGFVVADCDRLPFRSEVFDMGTCFGVLQYLESAEEAISSMNRVLKTKGRLFLSTQNQLNIVRYVGTLIGRYDDRAKRYNPLYLIRVLGSNGFHRIRLIPIDPLIKISFFAWIIGVLAEKENRIYRNQA